MARAAGFRWVCAAAVMGVTMVAAVVKTDALVQRGAPTAKERCPLTVAQVNAATGATLKQTEGSCTFFPAKGGDSPRVFYVLQNPMVCTSIQPGELNFTEKVDGLPAKSAYVRDQLDGAHVLVCPNNNGRAFDVVVEIKNNKPQNRAAAIALAKQVLEGK